MQAGELLLGLGRIEDALPVDQTGEDDADGHQAEGEIAGQVMIVVGVQPFVFRFLLGDGPVFAFLALRIDAAEVGEHGVMLGVMDVVAPASLLSAS